jgi:hypothetical protein
MLDIDHKCKDLFEYIILCVDHTVHEICTVFSRQPVLCIGFSLSSITTPHFVCCLSLFINIYTIKQVICKALDLQLLDFSS